MDIVSNSVTGGQERGLHQFIMNLKSNYRFKSITSCPFTAFIANLWQHIVIQEANHTVCYYTGVCIWATWRQEVHWPAWKLLCPNSFLIYSPTLRSETTHTSQSMLIYYMYSTCHCHSRLLVISYLHRKSVFQPHANVTCIPQVVILEN